MKLLKNKKYLHMYSNSYINQLIIKLSNYKVPFFNFKFYKKLKY